MVGNSFSGKSLQLNELVKLKQNSLKNKIELELVGKSDDIEIQKMIEKKCQINGSICSFGKYKENLIIIDDVDSPKICAWGDHSTS